jgi:two-component system nitrate/nitrite response regulator NarL
VVRQGETEYEERASPFAVLTPRELEILKHLSEGQSNKVIARNLGISDGTVKLHVKSILRKLDVHSRVEAAVMAVEKGLPSSR